MSHIYWSAESDLYVHVTMHPGSTQEEELVTGSFQRQSKPQRKVCRLYIQGCLLHNSTQHQTNILEKYGWHWRRERRVRLGHRAHFHTSGKSNHFWGTKRLIFFPLNLSAWRSTSVAPCSEREGHNWPWPQTAWGAKTAQPHIISPRHQSEETATEIKERWTVERRHSEKG